MKVSCPLPQHRARILSREGLISKHFIWSEGSWAGRSTNGAEDARRFIPALARRNCQRYGMQPQIDFYEVFAVTDNVRALSIYSTSN
jgi:hypothetical protein